METVKKLRILMLHGRQQNKEILQSRTTGKKKWLKDDKHIELIYVDAPHQMVEKGEDGEPLYAWWYSDRDDKEGKGIFLTLDYMRGIFKDKGPFDGVFGFSQGI
jgi:hypothetical protein